MKAIDNLSPQYIHIENVDIVRQEHPMYQYDVQYKDNNGYPVAVSYTHLKSKYLINYVINNQSIVTMFYHQMNETLSPF